MTTEREAPDLPSLPEPGQASVVFDSVMQKYEVYSFTADQMRAYARAALEAAASPTPADSTAQGPSCTQQPRTAAAPVAVDPTAQAVPSPSVEQFRRIGWTMSEDDPYYTRMIDDRTKEAMEQGDRHALAQRFDTPVFVCGEKEEPEASAQAVPSKGVWPFVESPGDFAVRLRIALGMFDGDMVAAVRNVLIENPPQARAERAAVPASSELTFSAFRKANAARCIKWHPAGIASWSPSDWLTAVAGELGELASLLKMRNRERDGLPGNKFSPTQKQIADELADVLTYLDLLAEVLGVDLGAAAAEKFNEVSERVGFPDRITLAAVPASVVQALIDALEDVYGWKRRNSKIGSPMREYHAVLAALAQPSADSAGGTEEGKR